MDAATRGKTAAERLADHRDLMNAVLAAARDGKDTSLLKQHLEQAIERLNEVLNEGRR